MPRLRKILKTGLFLATLLTVAICGIQFIQIEQEKDYENMSFLGSESSPKVEMRVKADIPGEYGQTNHKADNIGKTLPPDEKFPTPEKSQEALVQPKLNEGLLDSNPNVHAFYYAWYGSPEEDGEYIHWNHEYLPHWNAKISAQYPTGQKHQPPDDIGSTFYPLLGPYSSVDERITRTHMLQMQQAGIGVLALSWYPPKMADDNGKAVEDYVPIIFDIAEEFDIKICFHIEPYKDRNADSMRRNIEYIIDTYGNHPAFYRHISARTDEELPLIYLYDSYLIKSNEWQRLFSLSGDLSIRKTKYDCFAIGLLVEEKQLRDISSSGFDGMYTYFAADGFTFGSTRTKWKNIADFSSRNNLMFIPSVGPGYDDTRVRPWNKKNSKSRQEGSYYEAGWKAATSSHGVEIISITSFNEWHEGTQIEPADAEPLHGSFTYLTYGSKGPDFYLQLTRKWADLWRH